MNIEQKVLANLHKLPPEKQLVVLYVVESLVHPTTQPRSQHPDKVEAAWQRSLARMKRGYHLGGQMPSRESLPSEIN